MLEISSSPSTPPSLYYYTTHNALSVCAPRTLSLSLVYWLLATPMLPDFDLYRVELDINDMI
jgi:hypothetical protein